MFNGDGSTHPLELFASDATFILTAAGSLRLPADWPQSGDVVLPLMDGRELRLRRVRRPDPEQAEVLARLGIELPERVGVDSMASPM